MAKRLPTGPYPAFIKALQAAHPDGSWRRSANTPHMAGVGSNVCIPCALASARIHDRKGGAHTFVESCRASRAVSA